ncbi:LOW QUALITY PROTEIN: probable WRKY transcription factor 40 [Pyrus x bretschneideri]|uniref:LOW QUALITY PROTEIN: probable WRKY transcription factor 40 n=1 Tax=Pyrus x bretschneideri TaxID=225117 RepID=UPI000870B680|nr:LOW QUALITY PROTEIN: probable WRKY transcription factor 40 [Pyrus x bretschneideri]
MDSTWVNTSLGLNLVPLCSADDHQAPATMQHELERDYAQFQGNNALVKEEQVASHHDVWAEELNRISVENKKLTETLTALCENYNSLQSHLRELMITKQQQNNSSDIYRKRKAGSEDYNNVIGLISPGTNTDTSSISDDQEYSCKRPKEHTNLKISRVYVRTDASDTRLIVKDGYQWRKYGQKVTRDNPSPRAYYKCSFAPSCPVKKKVQKSAENPCVLVATYEGEHNHMHPESRAEITLIAPVSPNQNQQLITSTPLSVSPSMAKRSAPPTFSCDINRISPNTTMCPQETEAAAFQQFLIQQMASSLTKDPNFTSALAAAISGRISDHS